MYEPTSEPGGELPAVSAWIYRELVAIARSFYNLDQLRLKETNVEPTKPRAGDIRLADGTNWNPGSGAGFYGYYAGNWSKLG